jgi:hypothetical protein
MNKIFSFFGLTKNSEPQTSSMNVEESASHARFIRCRGDFEGCSYVKFNPTGRYKIESCIYYENKKFLEHQGWFFKSWIPEEDIELLPLSKSEIFNTQAPNKPNVYDKDDHIDIGVNEMNTNPLDDLPQIHPREENVQLAKTKLLETISEIRKMDLTNAEFYKIITITLSDEWGALCKYWIRSERHPEDPNPPGGIK